MVHSVNRPLAHLSYFNMKHICRTASHYGCPSWEAGGLNGQTSLGVQRNGLKVASIVHELESLQSGTVWSFQRPSLRSKPSVMNSHGLSTWMAIWWSLKRPSPKSIGRRSIPLYFLPETIPPILWPRSCQCLISFMEKRDGLSTIVWVFILVWPKLPSRFRCHGKKVLPCRHYKLRRPLDFGL
jgi:hypothetical protein